MRLEVMGLIKKILPHEEFARHIYIYIYIYIVG